MRGEQMRKTLRDKRWCNDSQNCKKKHHLFRAHAHLAPGCNWPHSNFLPPYWTKWREKKKFSLLFCEREPEINPAVFASALPAITPRGSTEGQERCSVFHLKRSHFVETEDTKSFSAPHFFPRWTDFLLGEQEESKVAGAFCFNSLMSLPS